MRTFGGLGDNQFRYDSAKEFTAPVIFTVIVSLCWILACSFIQPKFSDHAFMNISKTWLSTEALRT